MKKEWHQQDIISGGNYIFQVTGTYVVKVDICRVTLDNWGIYAVEYFFMQYLQALVAF